MSTEFRNQQAAETSWQDLVAKYQNPRLRHSIWQIVNSVIPYFVLWYLMYLSLEVSYWLTLGLSVLAAGFLMRIFIIFHDCGHGSFFKSRKANAFWGFLTGLLTLTPYHQWRHDHAVHHATSGDLDRRGVGDIWTMTVDEYHKAALFKKFWYRIYRNPVVMLGLGGMGLFLVRNRFPSRKTNSKTARKSVHWTNLSLTLILILFSLTIGLSDFALVQAPIFIIGLAAGVWLFYVQHQFEGVYWAANTDEWDFVDAALQGSSFYKLPKILQWFSGNIGFHHIHHLSPRIPNYQLETCHEENALFQKVEEVTLINSLKSLRFRLWDEENNKLVGFRFAKKQGVNIS